MNRRRAVLVLAAIAPWAAIPLARSQSASRMPRIGVLVFGSPVNFRPRAEAFRKGMEELGYFEGRNVHYEWRSANGQPDLLSQEAHDLAKVVDVIVSASAHTTRALQEAQVTLPIVMAAVDDPVADGFAASLAHPGANFTGLSANVIDHAPRFVELLSQTTEKLTRIGVLANPSSPTYKTFRSRIEKAAIRAGARPIVLDATTPEQLETAFPATGQDVFDGMVVMYDSLFYSQRLRVVELARDTRRPAVYPQRGYVEAGGLMSYGPHLEENYRRAASYVDRILKGARPRDMAIEPPAHFELVINRAAARGLGVKLPADFLAKADRIIG